MSLNSFNLILSVLGLATAVVLAAYSRKAFPGKTGAYYVGIVSAIVSSAVVVIPVIIALVVVFINAQRTGSEFTELYDYILIGNVIAQTILVFMNRFFARRMLKDEITLNNAYRSGIGVIIQFMTGMILVYGFAAAAGTIPNTVQPEAAAITNMAAAIFFIMASALSLFALQVILIYSVKSGKTKQIWMAAVLIAISIIPLACTSFFDYVLLNHWFPLIIFSAVNGGWAYGFVTKVTRQWQSENQTFPLNDSETL